MGRAHGAHGNDRSEQELNALPIEGAQLPELVVPVTIDRPDPLGGDFSLAQHGFILGPEAVG